MKLSKQQFIQDYKEHYQSVYSDTIDNGFDIQYYYALGSLLRSYISKPWNRTRDRYEGQDVKQVYYFSIEFLPGKFLRQSAYNLGILEVVKEGLKDLGLHFDEIAQAEAEPAIGNGGLGRLAACYLDSGASLALPLHGNGIRYRYGLFQQRFVDGYQVELPDDWLRNNMPWEIRNIGKSVRVRLGGNVWLREDGVGGLEPVYEEATEILAVPYDYPMIGFQNDTVNDLRLWSAEVNPEQDRPYATEELKVINNITSNLYPDDSTPEGKELRLIQEYFFVSAGVQSIFNEYRKKKLKRSMIPERIAIQINDTHPSLVIPELMRILLDEEKLSWDRAWSITQKTVAYTNHTVLREAMETWPVDMMKRIAPRMYQIIETINNKYIEENIDTYGHQLVYSTSIIKDGQIHMANLSIIGSYSVNGVANLHTDILIEDTLNDFYEMAPHKFNNKNNGITPRRFVYASNPSLTQLISKNIGNQWISDPEEIKVLKAKIGDKEVLKQLAQVKKENKEYLAKYIKENQGIEVNTDAMFDVLIKRLHAYKRQHMQMLHIIDRYLELKATPDLDLSPRVFIFGAKAAPSYKFAKEVIKIINELANLINNDSDVNDKLQVVFLENYSVSVAEKVIPAADLSEQISLAGKEASGTGNMKMMFNGALTIGTMDGANVEIYKNVGLENMFIFGMDRHEVKVLNQEGNYHSRELYENNERLQRALNALIDRTIPNIQSEGQEVFNHLVKYNDEYYALKDFDSYIQAQKRADELYQDKENWYRKSLINIASAGHFSSDYAVDRYAKEIWKVRPVK